VCWARRERTAGLDHQFVGRQDPGPPTMRRMPGVQAHLILGAVQPGPDGPVSVTAAEGSRVTSEVMAIPASWDITLEWAAVERAAESNLHDQLECCGAFWVERRDLTAPSHQHNSVRRCRLNRENTVINATTDQLPTSATSGRTNDR
jgi:hypothetical protein